MGRVHSDSDSVFSEEEIINSVHPYPFDQNSQYFRDLAGIGSDGDDEENIKNMSKKKKKVKKKSEIKKQVMLEGYVEVAGEEEEEGKKRVMARTKSLTGDHLDELKGCLDLGFGFNYEEIPELCNTLPALELCYSMSQRFSLDEQQHRSPPELAHEPSCSTSSPIANWRISGPGDHPEDVKARLKFWAQAVACTVKLCN